MEETGINEGDEIDVKLLDVDKKTGKYKLSHRVLVEKPEGYVERPARPERGERSDRQGRGDRRDNHGRGDRHQSRHSDFRKDEHVSEGDASAEGVKSALDDFLK